MTVGSADRTYEGEEKAMHLKNYLSAGQYAEFW